MDDFTDLKLDIGVPALQPPISINDELELPLEISDEEVCSLLITSLHHS